MITLKAASKGMIFLGILFLATQTLAGESPVSKIPKDKLSYSVGVDIARNFKRVGLDVDVDLLAAAMKDVLAGEKLKYSEAEIRNIMTVYQAELRQKAILTMRDTAIKNRTAGGAFLAENKNKEGVVSLPSGLQYKILTAGTGKTPTDADLVECNYRGTLIDGTEFDSSYRTGKPAILKVAEVIAGWKEALKLMPVGSKWQLFVPSQLAYGDRGAGRDIGPNATLIFEVELLAVK